MFAKDVMTSNVVTAGPEATIEEIADILLSQGISAVPIVGGDGKLKGIVSEGDLVSRPELGVARRRSWWLEMVSGTSERARDYLKSHSHRAADIMTTDLVTVREDTPLSDIARKIEERHIKRVPVVKDGALVGVVSRADLLRAFACHVATPSSAPTDDRAIRSAIETEIRGADLDTRGYVNVIVTDGVAHLWGGVSSDIERKALETAARSVDGVTGVEDHLMIVKTYISAA